MIGLKRIGLPTGGALLSLLALLGCAPSPEYANCKPADFTLGADRLAVCARSYAARVIPTAATARPN